jgi:hypothetical protein
MRAALDNHDVELRPMPPPATHDPGFLDSMDKHDDRLAPAFPDPDAAFWRVPADPATAFVAITDLTIDRSARSRTAIQFVALSLGFFLLILAGAAASAFVFADRIGRLWM